jgi:hypothetical protein
MFLLPVCEALNFNFYIIYKYLWNGYNQRSIVRAYQTLDFDFYRMASLIAHGALEREREANVVIMVQSMIPLSVEG